VSDYKPGSMGLDGWKRFCEVNPPREGESRTDWIDRLSREAGGVVRREAPAGLPYRDSEPAEPGSDE